MAASRGNYFCRFLPGFVVVAAAAAPTNNGKNKPKAPVKQWPRQESSHGKSNSNWANRNKACPEIEKQVNSNGSRMLPVPCSLGLSWACPALAWPGLGWQTKRIFQFSQNVFLRKQNQGEGRQPARQAASPVNLPCVERLSEVINLLKHTDTYECGK